MSDEVMLVYLTKHVFTRGIVVKKILKSSVLYDNNILVEGEWYQGDEWHITPLCAIVRAEEMRAQRIEVLKKSITEIENLVFTMEDRYGT